MGNSVIRRGLRGGFQFWICQLNVYLWLITDAFGPQEQQQRPPDAGIIQLKIVAVAGAVYLLFFSFLARTKPHKSHKDPHKTHKNHKTKMKRILKSGEQQEAMNFKRERGNGRGGGGGKTSLRWFLIDVEKHSQHVRCSRFSTRFSRCLSFEWKFACCLGALFSVFRLPLFFQSVPEHNDFYFYAPT